MSMTRRQFNRLFMSSLAAASLPAGLLPATAQARTSTPTLIEGGNWAPIVPPQPGDNPGKIEVLEFFSYGCPHCRDFNPLVTRWASKAAERHQLPPRADLFRPRRMENLARLFYGLAAYGELERMDQKVFDAIHVSKTNLYAEQAMLNWGCPPGPRYPNAARCDALLRRGKQCGPRRRAGRRLQSIECAHAHRGWPLFGLERRRKVLPDLLDFADGLIAKARQDRRPGKRR